MSSRLVSVIEYTKYKLIDNGNNYLHLICLFVLQDKVSLCVWSVTTNNVKHNVKQFKFAPCKVFSIEVFIRELY